MLTEVHGEVERALTLENFQYRRELFGTFLPRMGIEVRKDDERDYPDSSASHLEKTSSVLPLNIRVSGSVLSQSQPIPVFGCKGNVHRRKQTRRSVALQYAPTTCNLGRRDNDQRRCNHLHSEENPHDVLD